MIMIYLLLGNELQQGSSGSFPQCSALLSSGWATALESQPLRNFPLNFSFSFFIFAFLSVSQTDFEEDSKVLIGEEILFGALPTQTYL